MFRNIWSTLPSPQFIMTVIRSLRTVLMSKFLHSGDSATSSSSLYILF